MKRLNLILLTVGIAGMTLTSCRKASTGVNDQSQSTKDVNSVNNAMNATADDAANAAGQVKGFSGKTESRWWNSSVLCGTSTVDTGTTGHRVITITYDSTTICNGVVRSGTVTVTNNSGTGWNQPNAQLTVNISNLHVTDHVTGGSYTVNGTHTITNETGGLAWEIIAGIAPANTTVTHRNTSSNMTVTFADGAQRSWTVDRTRSWSNASGNVSVTVSAEATGNVTETGTNRYGETFTNKITSPIIATNQGCMWRPYTGQWEHDIAGRTATVLFGANAAGSHVGTPTTSCSTNYGYFITYSNGTNSWPRFVSYW